MTKKKPATHVAAPHAEPLAKMSAHEIVLTTHRVGDTGRIVELEQPTRDRLYVEGEARFEYVGDDPQGRRVYRNQARD